MQLIIRYVQARGVGRETQEVLFDGDRATIGRGTDRSIQIQDRRLALAHSWLAERGGKLEMRCEAGESFSAGGQIEKRRELKAGDVINILDHQLKVMESEAPGQFVIEVTIDNSAVEPLRNRFKTRLWELGLPVRKTSWALFLIVLTIGIVIPGTGLLIGMQTMRDSPLPDDSVWLAGELHPTHAFIADDCNYCHAYAFEHARDEECLTCHLSVNHHFDVKFHGRDYKIGNYCQDCHAEHSGPAAIIRRDQAVCTVCHANLEEAGLESERLQDASDFLLDHPPFKLSMQEWDGKDWFDVRKELWDEELSERSNLVFPHDVHLAEEGIQGAEAKVKLACTDCHEAEKGGLRMKTVTMEKHCASCHTLTFDPLSPERVVPHGDPADLMRNLREYYAWQYLNKEVLEQKAGSAVVPAREARRPGQKTRDLITSHVPAGPMPPLSDVAESYISDRVARAAENLFERQTCTICHDIALDSSSEVPYKVLPVKLTADWMPYAEFSHNSHKNMQCVGCHEADYSASAGDVLMPDIGSCRACHGGEDANDRLKSNCVTCHKFHLANQGPMGALVKLDEDGNMIDDEGNLIDEEGNIIDEQNDIIEEQSETIDEPNDTVAPVTEDGDATP